MKLVDRLPAYAWNGFAVALGIGGIQLLIGLIMGSHAAHLALCGAVCASLADVPNTGPRTRYRVSAAAGLSVIAALAVAALKPFPVALGFGMMAMAFVAMMTMAWGVRAGAVSFAPILSLVFSMSIPESAQAPWEIVAWNAVGSVAYLAWSLLAGRVLQTRYQRLALVETLRATANLLRARGALLAATPLGSPQAEAVDLNTMQAWIKGEAALAEQLQTARDFVFAQADTEPSRRATAILLRAIELRDVLLASRLDLDRLGTDHTGLWIAHKVADTLRELADGLDAAAMALRQDAVPAPRGQALFDVRVYFAQPPMAPGDTRARLLPVIVDRLLVLGADVDRIHALLRGAQTDLPLTRAQLQRFVAPEGWPLKALSAHLSGQSPVLRHAARFALALGAAYFIALALPWASHPHWLVLSVAVVLRGNLEQTLARRNARVLGTLLGCALVVLLSLTGSVHLQGLIFLVAVGVAHAFVLQRYWLTATAATVMALLQAHMVDPSGGFAVGERVADTLLGALLAWGFSYVLPSWERRRLPKAVADVLKALGEYAAQALTWQGGDGVEQRLARRRAYDALSALAGALQRSAAEPKAVQVPVKEVVALIDHGQRLMAHLSLVRMTLVHRSAALHGDAARGALAETRQAIDTVLHLRASNLHAAVTDPEELSLLPTETPTQDVTPWLLRRLKVLMHDAVQIRDMAFAVLAKGSGLPRR